MIPPDGAEFKQGTAGDIAVEYDRRRARLALLLSRSHALF